MTEPINVTFRLPEEVADLIKSALEEYPLSIDNAVAASYSALEEQDGWDELVRNLAIVAIRGYIHQIRHLRNRAARKESGRYSTTSRVDSAQSERVAIVHRDSVFGYYVAGKRLGEMTGRELDTEIAHSEEKVKTETFHVRLFRRLRNKLGDNDTVQGKLKEKLVRKWFDEELEKSQQGAVS